MNRTIFFDLDGTLIDTSERHYRVYKDILDFYGISNLLSKEEFWNQKRRGRKTSKLLPEISSKEFIKKFMDEWLKRIEDQNYLRYDSLLGGSLGILSILKDKDDLILVTLRNNKENLLWELNNFGLTSYFKEILVDLPVGLKNKVPLIKDYIERCSKENNLIIVGDTEADISTGKDLGILTIAVTYGIRSKEFLRKLKPNFCLANLSELLDILKDLKKIGGKL
jgi:phosphoglycolate phosphatase